MIAYWILLLIPCLVCLQTPRRHWSLKESVIIGIALTLFVGFRHEVGGDWLNYTLIKEKAVGLSLAEVLVSHDPGYSLVNWYFSDYEWGIYFINFLMAAIFSFGLVKFCNSQPRPYLALSIAIPYLVIVVAMGYTRQSAAIGLLFLGLISLERGKLTEFFWWIAGSSIFHFSSIFMIFLAPSVEGKTLVSRIVRLLAILTSGIALIYIFIIPRMNQMLVGYVLDEYQAEGAFIRVLMNLVPGIIFCLWQDRFRLAQQQNAVWRLMAYASIACAAALIAFPNNTTAVDRISLFLIPLQIFVGSRIPDTSVLGLKPRNLLASVVIVCILVQLVWLNFAVNAGSWLPYNNLLFL